MFVIEDIAHALSMIPRWGGHYHWFLSVAEHSRSVAYVTKGDKLEALLHDASEAYLMDLPRPIKQNMPEYKAIEDGVMKVIAEKFGIGFPFSEETKLADKAMLESEWKSKVIFCNHKLTPHFDTYNFNRQRRQFMDDFDLYIKNRN
jgi:5'-deoxynucleotidase YfbR-like HD superfamily hydrolase